jgi:hypothetical protein
MPSNQPLVLQLYLERIDFTAMGLDLLFWSHLAHSHNHSPTATTTNQKHKDHMFETING